MDRLIHVHSSHIQFKTSMSHKVWNWQFKKTKKKTMWSASTSQSTKHLLSKRTHSNPNKIHRKQSIFCGKFDIMIYWTSAWASGSLLIFHLTKHLSTPCAWKLPVPFPPMVRYQSPAVDHFKVIFVGLKTKKFKKRI